MMPKMPAKMPRSVLWNHAALIFTMPGAPNDWKYPFISASSAKVVKVLTSGEKPSTKLMMIVPIAPISIDRFPPWRSREQPVDKLSSAVGERPDREEV